jgi:hypothetical protein
MKTYISSLLMLVLVFSACKKEDNTDNTNESSDAFPFIKAGHEWHFWYSASGNITSNELVYKILSVGADGYIEVECEFAGLITDNIYWYADDNVFSEIASPEDNYYLPLLKVNPVLNDSWSATVNDEGQMVTITRKVIALSDSVQLPDNSYIRNCIKVHETMSGYSQYYKDIWVSKDDGIVRIEGKGYIEEDGSPPEYFDLAYILFSKSF